MDSVITKLKLNANKSFIKHKHSSALIDSNSNIFSIGINKFVKHVQLKESNYYRTIHAEMALFKTNVLIKKNSKNLDIIVIRINNKNELINSRPCRECIEKLKFYGIRKVYYSDNYGDIVSELLCNMGGTGYVSSGNRHNC